jgi:D-3-phosphoglycerate dehydrogenase
MMKKVLIPTKLDAVAGEILEASGHYTVVQDDAAELRALATTHSDAYALIVRSEKVTPEIIDLLPNLQVVVRAGAGFNTIDTRYARSRGIDVMNTPGANSNAVAEEVVAMILADARHLIPADASTRAGKWEKKQFMGRELAGKTVGIVGLGNIGRLVAKRISGFDCRLLGFDPVISSERAKEVDVTLTDLQTIFSECDYITLHIPENDDTRGLVGKDLLALTREGATIVNCARAGIVDEDALREVKASRGLRLLNDVYPKDAAGDKTVTDIADIMLPHLGASTREANYNAARRAAEELIDLDYKGVTSFIVNRDIPEGLDEAYCELANTLARLCRNIVGRQSALKMVETSFYGDLEPYANWLTVPIVAGIWEDFERGMDYHAAFNYLDEMGIEYVPREVDASKGYGNSITLDLTSEVDSGNLRRISVRGTLTEGNMMVARINEFDRLYFEPLGHTVCFLYDDRPGVIGIIGGKLATSGINIEDMRNPHDAKTGRSLAILKVNQRVPDEIIDTISQEINSFSAFHISL